MRIFLADVTGQLVQHGRPLGGVGVARKNQILRDLGRAQIKIFEHFKKKLEVIFNIIVGHTSYLKKKKYYEQVIQELENFKSMIQGLKVDNEQTKNSLITTLDKQISRINDPILKTYNKQLQKIGK